MVKRLFTGKLLAFFASMAIIGFFIGYDYAMITTKYSNSDAIINSSSGQKQDEINKAGNSQNDEEYDADQNGDPEDLSGF